MRLDDASEYMDVEKWRYMEKILDKYNIKPIVGVIPNNQDPDMVNFYSKDDNFWEKVHNWDKKGWSIAFHGFSHVFETRKGGVNPVNDRSEFAGLSLEKQKEKIKKGLEIFKKHGFNPRIFFAPAHTFDENTLQALKEETDIRIISDTIANDIYYENGFYFIPQQSGKVRKLPFRIITFCYHPNIMQQNDFFELEKFCKLQKNNFIDVSKVSFKKRKRTILDIVLKKAYFLKKRSRNDGNN